MEVGVYSIMWDNLMFGSSINLIHREERLEQGYSCNW